MLNRVLHMVTRPKKWLEFDRPEIRHLDCLHLVLENKALLLLEWNVSKTTDIYVLPIRKSYFQSQGAAIHRLPAGTTSVTLIVRNLWRRHKIEIPLKRVTIDAEITEQFDINFHQSTSIRTPNFRYREKQIRFLKTATGFTLPVSLKPYLLSIKQFPFHDS